MDRPKIVALITGILSIALAVFYLALVLILDHRSGLEPAPVGGGWLRTWFRAWLRAQYGESAMNTAVGAP